MKSFKMKITSHVSFKDDHFLIGTKYNCFIQKAGFSIRSTCASEFKSDIRAVKQVLNELINCLF